MKPVIYSTRKAATSGTPINVTRDWETVLVQFNDFIVTETRTGIERNEGIIAMVCTVAKFGGLTEHLGAVSHGKSMDYCKRSANRMLRKYLGIELDEPIAEGQTLSEMHASFTDASVHERFKVWAASLFE